MPTVDLPEDGELQLGGVRLPAGRRIVAGYGSGAPLAWATAVPVPDPGRIWQALSELSPATGLVPFLLAGLDDTCARPWDDNEFSDPADISAVGRLDATQLLAELWSGQFEDDDSDPDDEDEGEYENEEYDDEFQAMIAPFSRQFPGLAPAAAQRLTQAETDRVLGSLKPARIGVAAASRPADVLPLIGWDGAVNHGDGYAVVIAAILRSWEQRFGARLLRVGFAETQLLADRPPRTLQAARLLAAEQFAFCDERAGQGLHDVTSITDHLLNSPLWTFWWD